MGVERGDGMEAESGTEPGSGREGEEGICLREDRGIQQGCVASKINTKKSDLLQPGMPHPEH